MDVITQLYDNIENNKFSCILTLDLIKAFDTVKHDILLGKLEHYGVRGICHTLLHSYLKNRNQFVSFQNNYSSLKLLSCGVPQGLILGQFLFLVYINDLPNALSNKPRLYADDTCLTVTSSSIVGSVVEWLKRRAREQHGLGSKPIRAIMLCLWERPFTTYSPAWWFWQAVLNYSHIFIKLQADSNILASLETGGGNCLPYVLTPPSLSCESGG